MDTASRKHSSCRPVSPVLLLLGALLLLLAFVAPGRRVRTPPAERESLSWPVMGTIAQLTVRGNGAAATARDLLPTVQQTYAHLENLLSAWNPDSELSRLAAAHTTNWLVAASPEVRPCYAAALKLARESGHAFNPQVGARLRALGVAGNAAYCAFDLGAIAKGFAVDAAAAALAPATSAAAAHAAATLAPATSATADHAAASLDILLDLGGNLRAIGPGVWRTGIRNPFDKTGPFVGVLALTNGESIATSGTYERFIERNGVRLSHILDGRTGEPTRGVAAVTVVTPADYGATLADGLSTTLFVLGPADGAAFLARHYPRALALWIPDTPAAPRIRATSEMIRRLESPIWPTETP